MRKLAAISTIAIALTINCGDDGESEPECRTNIDCALETRCQQGICIPGCDSDSDCPYGKICTQNSCTPICTVTPADEQAAVDNLKDAVEGFWEMCPEYAPAGEPALTCAINTCEELDDVNDCADMIRQSTCSDTKDCTNDPFDSGVCWLS